MNIYKKRINRVALLLLVQLLAGNAGAFAAVGLYLFAGLTALGYQLAGTSFYLASMIIPVLLCKIVTGVSVADLFKLPGVNVETARKKQIFTMLPVITFATIAVVLCAGYANSMIMYLLELAGLSVPVIDISIYAAGNVVEFIVYFCSLAVIPALFEELLFRGVILHLLLPSGKKTAVIVSAVTFGLFHQNPAQILYATVAGFLFGIIAVYGGSIWPCIIIHFVNNAIAFAEVQMDSALAPDIYAVYAAVIDGVLIFGGFICLLFLLAKRKSYKKAHGKSAAAGITENAESESYVEFAEMNDFDSGTAEKKLSGSEVIPEIPDDLLVTDAPPESDAAESRKIRYVRGFFSPLMIVYLLLVGSICAFLFRNV